EVDVGRVAGVGAVLVVGSETQQGAELLAGLRGEVLEVLPLTSEHELSASGEGEVRLGRETAAALVEVRVAGREAVRERAHDAPVLGFVAQLDVLGVVLVEDLVGARAVNRELVLGRNELFAEERELELTHLQLDAVAEVVADPGLLEAEGAAVTREVPLD